MKTKVGDRTPVGIKRRWRPGDRYDGYKVRKLDPMFELIPYIMRSREDSQVFFEERFDITELDRFIAAHRKDIPGISVLNVITAALVRTISQKPKLNRFTSGGKIYARKYLRFSVTIKQSLTEDAEESNILPEFSVYDTLYDVIDKMRDSINETKRASEEGNDTDVAVKVLGILPGWLKRFIVFACRNLDKIGLMPKAVNKFSPFHSSVYITQVGSLGIDSIFHHLYEFGTTSAFVSIGKKDTVRTVDPDGEPDVRKYINLKFVLDERIVDGFYYASAIKYIKNCLKKPETLLVPPESIVEDI